MVGVIYITSQKHFIPTSKKYNKFEYCFDDWTSYFTDLLYWNTEIDLNNKTLTEALHKLSVAISRLERENIKPKSYVPEDLLPTWWFGVTMKSPNSYFTKNLTNEERKPILMLHLLNLYYKLNKIYKKNKIYYCYNGYN